MIARADTANVRPFTFFALAVVVAASACTGNSSTTLPRPEQASALAATALADAGEPSGILLTAARPDDCCYNSGRYIYRWERHAKAPATTDSIEALLLWIGGLGPAEENGCNLTDLLTDPSAAAVRTDDACGWRTLPGEVSPTLSLAFVVDQPAGVFVRVDVTRTFGTADTLDISASASKIGAG